MTIISFQFPVIIVRANNDWKSDYTYVFAKYNLTINIEKTELIVIHSYPENIEISLQGETSTADKWIEYLQSVIDDTGKVEIEMAKRIRDVYTQILSNTIFNKKYKEFFHEQPKN